MTGQAALAELLEAIRAVLDVPYPAAMEDWELGHGRVLTIRAAELRGALAYLTQDSPLREIDMRQVARQARAIAARPLPYEPRRDGGQE